MPVVNNVCGVSMGSAERRCWKDGEHTCFLKSFWRGRVIFLSFLMQALLVECVENPFKQHEVEAGFWTAPHTYVHPHNRMFCYSRGCLAQYFYPRPWFKWSCMTSLKSPSKEKPDEFTEATPIWQKPPPYSQTTWNPGTECAFFGFVFLRWATSIKWSHWHS